VQAEPFKPEAPAGLFATAKPVTTLTLQEAIEIALQNKPNLQAYKHAIEASKAKGMQVWADYLPQVGLTTNISQGLAQGDPQTNITLDAQQLVYTFAGPIEKYKMAKKQTNIVELSSDKDKKAVRNAVEAAFLECWKVQRQQATVLALHQSSTVTYQKQAHANKLQLLDKNEWLKSNTDHAQNLALIDNYYQGVELTQKKLEFFMGQPIDLALTKLEKPTSTPGKKQHILTLALEWQAPEAIKPLPLTTYYKCAMKSREELKIADKNVGVAKDQVYIAQRSNLPRLDVVASTGYQSRESTAVSVLVGNMGSLPARNFYSFGARVTWPIFNGLLNDYIEKEAHATMLKEILTKDQALQDIKLAVDTAYYALNQTLITIKAKKIDLIYTRNNLKLKKLQFKVGDISKIELDAAVTEWERAEYAWLDLVTDAAIKERNLAFACGYPQELS
jgi:outer membrane protein TolC